jgi:XTP/dITP diphosphohydrolase
MPLVRVLIASSNLGKLRDFAAAAAAYGVEIACIQNFRDLPAVVEDAPTFEGNACKKAEHYSRLVPGELVLADDSGLEVEYLNGAPGIHSARYAAHDDAPETSVSNAPDAANNARLLRELAGVPDELRGARFVAVIAAARDGRTLATFRGEAGGRIIQTPRGSGGFGYDPLFFFPEHGKTFAELTAEEKAAVSHRGQAFRKFLQWVGAGALTTESTE